jgi:hypothetical protein
MGPNARFGYPLRGGFQALMDGFLPHLEGKLRLNARVKELARMPKAERDTALAAYAPAGQERTDAAHARAGAK